MATKKKLKLAKKKPAQKAELSSLRDLKASPKNPRRISADNLARLKRTLQEYGDLSGIVWNARTGELVAGHQRIRALTEEHGEENVRLEKTYEPQSSGPGDVIRVYLETPVGEFDVRVVDWDEAKADAAMIAANSLDAQGEYDTESLSALIDELRADIRGDLPELIGFSDLTLNSLPLLGVEDFTSATVGKVTKQAPDEFPLYDENIKTDYKCPKCKYEWSGKQK